MNTTKPSKNMPKKQPEQLRKSKLANVLVKRKQTQETISVIKNRDQKMSHHTSFAKQEDDVRYYNPFSDNSGDIVPQIGNLTIEDEEVIPDVTFDDFLTIRALFGIRYSTKSNAWLNKFTYLYLSYDCVAFDTESYTVDQFIAAHGIIGHSIFCSHDTLHEHFTTREWFDLYIDDEHQPCDHTWDFLENIHVFLNPLTEQFENEDSFVIPQAGGIPYNPNYILEHHQLKLIMTQRYIDTGIAGHFLELMLANFDSLYESYVTYAEVAEDKTFIGYELCMSEKFWSNCSHLTLEEWLLIYQNNTRCVLRTECIVKYNQTFSWLKYCSIYSRIGYWPSWRVLDESPEFQMDNLGPRPGIILPEQYVNSLRNMQPERSVIRPQVLGFELGLDTDTSEIADEFIKVLREFASNGVKINTDTINALKEMSSNVSNTNHSFSFGGFDLTAMKDQLPEIMVVGIAVVFVYNYRPKSNMESATLYGIIMAVVTCYYSGVGKNFIDRLSTSVNPQAGFTPEEMTDLLTSVLNLFVCSKLNFSPFDASDLLSLGSKLKNANLGFKPMLLALTTLITYIGSKISQHMTTQYPGSFVLTGHEYIDVWLNEVNEIREAHAKQELYAMGASLERVAAAIKKGKEILIRIGPSRDVLQFRAFINEGINKLEIIDKALKATNFKFGGLRQEPVAIMLRGPPGCGKSSAMQHICHALAARLFSEEERKRYIDQPNIYVFNRQSEGVYWDGYDSNKKMCLFDDLGQQRDVAGNPDNEIMGCIRAINIFEDLLHCAAIELKGNTSFRSAFVIANTNLTNFLMIESINDKEAFIRRWDIVVDVSPKAEYCINPELGVWDRRFDLSKLPLITGTQTTDRNVHQLEFHLMRRDGLNFVNGDKTMLFGELIDSIVKRHEQKAAWHEQNLKNLDETFGENIPQAGELITMTTIDDVERIPLHYVEQWLIDNSYRYSWDRRVHMTRKITELMVQVSRIMGFVITMEMLKTSPCFVRAFLSETYEFLDDPLHPNAVIQDFINNYNVALEAWKFDQKPMLEKMVIKVGIFTLEAFNKIKSMIMSALSMVPEVIVIQVTRDFAIHFNIPIFVISLTTFYVSYAATEIVMMLMESLYKRFFSIEDGPVVESKANNVRIRRVARAIKPVIMEPHSIANGNEAVANFVNGRIYNNMYEVVIPNFPSRAPNGEMQTLGFAFMLKGYTGIMPWHFVSVIQNLYEEDERDKIDRLRNPNEGEPELVDGKALMYFYKCSAPGERYAIGLKHFISCIRHDDIGGKLERQDVMAFRLPRDFRPARSVTNAFMTEAELIKWPQVQSMLTLFPIQKLHKNRIANEFLQAQAVRHNTVAAALPMWDVVKSYRTWKYNMNTSPGDCGGILINNSKSRPCIIGMHFSGHKDGDYGFSTILTSEFIDYIIELVDDKYVYDETEEPDLVFCPPSDKVDNYEVVAELQGAFPSSAGKTKLMKSELYGKWREPKKKPAHLKPFTHGGVRIDPMSIAQSAYCKEDVYIPEDALMEAKESLQDWLYARSNVFEDKSILTFDEAVLGDNSGVFQSIPRSTSAGYPYSVMKGIKTKHRFFGTGDEYDLSGKECNELRLEVLRVTDKARSGVRLPHYFTDCLKDELRKNEKVDSGQTRMFSSCPTPLLIIVRQYFGAFQRWILKNSITNGIGVGINEYSTDWTMVANFLQELGGGEGIGAGDYKSFDMSQLPRIQWLILDIINHWYDDGDENKLIRTVLWYEVVNSSHLNGKLFTSWASSLSSGFALTWLVNALYNQLSFRIIYYFVFMTCDTFNDVIRLITTGDDHAYNAHERIRHIFTERRVQVEMAKIGLTYTSENKNNLLCEDKLRHLSEITYLKRRFVWDSETRRYVAPLELDTILEIPYWTRNLATRVFDTGTNIVTALEELSLHDRDTYEYWSRKIFEAIEAVGDPDLRKPPNARYHAMRRSVMNRGETDLKTVFIPQVKVNSVPLRHLHKIPSHFDVALTWGNIVFCSVDWTERENSFQSITPDSGLHMYGSEIINENPYRVLNEERYRSIKTYCQGGIVADPQNSRSLYDVVPQSQGQLVKCDTENSNSHNATTSDPVEQQGHFTHERSMPINVFSNSTTGNSADAEMPVAKMVNYTPLTTKVINNPDTGVSQEVRDFLKKPLIIATGNFASTDSIPTYNFFQGIPSFFLTNSIWNSKISGNYAFRGTLIITLVINANRFQQGRYLLGWIPDGGATGNPETGLPSVLGRVTTLVQKTQVPHVEIDLNCDTQCVLEIPLTNYTGWYITSATAGNYLTSRNGILFLSPYSPLVSAAGSTTAGWTMFAHWEDVDFCLPTVPQSGNRTRGRVSRRITPESAEQFEAGVGPISGFMAKVSTASQILSGVPLLSSIAGQVSWAASITGSVASVFGFSKPHNGAPVSLMQRFLLPRMVNADTTDGSTKLAVFDKNEVEDIPGFASSELDELAIGYLATIPAWVSSIQWTTSQAEGTLLHTRTLGPKFQAVPYTFGTNTVTYPAPVAWVANFFELWRGGLKVTVKIVKTEFHTGRLMVYFLPANTTLSGSTIVQPNDTNTSYLHREIIDVRYGNEFSFVVPYASINPYLSTTANVEGHFGYLYFEVLNPLVAPATVSSSVTLLFEVSGAPDIEFAQPRDIAERPVLAIVPQAGNENVCEIVSTEIGNSKSMFTLEPAKACIGERVLSLRSLLKKFTPINNGNVTTTTTQFVFYPFSILCDYLPSSNVISQNMSAIPDTYSHIALAFGLARGSMRFKIVAPFSDTNIYCASGIPYNGFTANVPQSSNFNYISSTITVGNLGNGSPMQVFDNNVSGMEVQFPMYSRYLSWPTADAINNDQGTLLYQGAAPRTVGRIYVPTAPAYFETYRAIGEDAHLGLFISCPGLTNWNGSID